MERPQQKQKKESREVWMLLESDGRSHLHISLILCHDLVPNLDFLPRPHPPRLGGAKFPQGMLALKHLSFANGTN